MLVVSFLLFAAAATLAVLTLWTSIVPNRARIASLLVNGPELVIDALPPVRLTSRRGVIRQRATPSQPGFRAAA